MPLTTVQWKDKQHWTADQLIWSRQTILFGLFGHVGVICRLVEWALKEPILQADKYSKSTADL